MFSPRVRILLSLISGLIITLGLIIAVKLALRPSGAFETRKKAAERGISGSLISFVGPATVKTGDRFSLDLIADTTPDPDYTLSGIDAVVVVHPPSGLSLMGVSPGKIFDNYPNIDKVSHDLNNNLIISGLKNFSLNNQNKFIGFKGRGVFATLNFVAREPGKTDIKLLYKGPNATDDTNINGYLAGPVSNQKTSERLLAAPSSFMIDIVSSGTSNIIAIPTQNLPSPSINLPTPTGSSKNIVTPKTPTGTGLPSNSPSNSALINFRLILDGRLNNAINVDIYGMKTTDGTSIQQFSRSNSIKIGATTTDINGFGKLNLDPSYIGRTFNLFAQTSPYLRKAALNYQPLTITSGNNPVCNSTLFLVAPPGYNSPDTNPCPTNGEFVDFGTLIAGDIYRDADGTRDNVINSFDVAQFYTAWSLVGKENQTQDELNQIKLADLNGDGTINTRDLSLILQNIGKSGDSFPPLSLLKK